MSDKKRQFRPRGVRYRDWLSLLRRNIMGGTVSDRAAQVSFYLLMSLFPFLFFLTALSAFLPIGSSVKVLLVRWQDVMPKQAFELVSGHITDLLQRPRPNFLTLGVIGTLWTASRGLDAIRKSLNHAYRVKETRPFWKTQAIALFTTLGGVVSTFVAIALIFWGGRMGTALVEELRTLGIHIWNVGPVWRWPLASLFLMGVSSLLYFVLPNVKQRFVYILPGSVVFSVLWLLASYGFGQYVEHLGRFHATYGTLGGFVILMLWLYISSWVFLFGGELNATIEHLANTNEHAGTP